MDSSHAQVAADIALGATASPARFTRSGHSTPSLLTLLKPAQLAFSATKSEVAWGAADDAAAAKKISDEAAAAKVTAMEEDLRKMSAMVQELARDLGAERAARLQLEETIQVWEQHYRDEEASEWVSESTSASSASGRKVHFDDDPSGAPPRRWPHVD